MPAEMPVLALCLAVALLGLAPSTASAQPLTCGQVITKDTTLHADLGPCPGDGLVIDAPNVTVDLNGHAIVGDDRGDAFHGDVGIRNGEGHDRTVIEHGEIRSFFTSIKLKGADDSRVSDITETEANGCCNGASVKVLQTRRAQIENNDLYREGDGSAFVVSGSRNSVQKNVGHAAGNGTGFLVSGSHNSIAHNAASGFDGMRIKGSENRVTHNHVYAYNGDFAVAGARNVIAANSVDVFGPAKISGPGNVVRKNVVQGEGGLDMFKCRNVRVEGNVFRSTDLVTLTGCQSARVEDNAVRRGTFGIELVGGSGNLIDGNTFSGTNGGIEVVDSSGNSISQNTISNTYSGKGGIAVQGGSNNSIEQNTTSETNASSGIFVTGGSVGTIVRGNLVTQAGFSTGGGDNDDGIHVEDPGTLIADNRANDNFDYGIQAVPGVIDGGGNTASGNGNPLQCLNVVCN
jgi:parallel beta-helix repeat protein